MKLGKINILLLALLVAGMAMVPCVSAADDTSAKKMAEPSPIVIDQQAQIAMQKQIIEDLDASKVIDAKEKKELEKNLQKIWKNDPEISESQKKEILKRVSEVLLQSQTGSITPKWVGCTGSGCDAAHNDMARIAGEKMGIANAYSTILYNNAGVPDTWSGSVNHYAISGAPDQVASWANDARPLIRSGSNPSQGYTYLAYAMHFMSDMSVPFHTAPLFLLKHSSYETYVDNNWDSGSIRYVDAITANNYYYYISDPSVSASNLASYSNQYQAYIVSAMDSASWGTNPTLIQDTRDCLLQGERYDMGLVDYVTRA
jgi:hypothetical protein